jgi:hypothetical protein
MCVSIYTNSSENLLICSQISISQNYTYYTLIIL